MKTIPILIASLLFCAFTNAECVVVGGPTASFEPASQEVRITALLDGKPLSAVRIDILTAANEPLFSLSTDQLGIVAVPTLSIGRYHVVATSRSTRFGEMYLGELFLDVDSHAWSTPTVHSIDLFSASGFRPVDLPIMENPWKTAQRHAEIGLVRNFRGVVTDPSGAVIPGAKVSALPEGSPYGTIPAETIGDEMGAFSMALAPGKYVGLVESPGFRPQRMSLEVAPQAEAKEIKISLNIGGC
jgi:hypothetical protein